MSWTEAEATQEEAEARAVPMVCTNREECGAEWFSDVDNGDLRKPDCPECGAEGQATSL